KSRLPPQAIYRLKPAGRHKPRPGVGRHALFTPLFQGGLESILQCIFSEVKVAEQPDQRRKYGPSLLSVDGIEGLGNMFSGIFHGLMAPTLYTKGYETLAEMARKQKCGEQVA